METHFRYPGQQDEEITKRVVHKHLFSIMPMLVGLIVLGLLGMVLLMYASANPSTFSLTIDPNIYGLVGLILFLIIIFLMLAIFWIWRHNIIVVTNIHLVDIDQMGLFNKKVSTLSWTRIQDVSAKVNGPFQTIFGYGTLNVQTAGEDKNFIFDYVPNPYELEHYILEMHKLVMQQDDGVAIREEEHAMAHAMSQPVQSPQASAAPAQPPAQAQSPTSDQPAEPIAGTYVPPAQASPTIQTEPDVAPKNLPKNPLEDA